MGQRVSTEWEVVLDEQAMMGKAAHLMREQLPEGSRLVAFTLRVSRNVSLSFLVDAQAMARHFGFTATPWDRFSEDFICVRFQRIR